MGDFSAPHRLGQREKLCDIANRIDHRTDAMPSRSRLRTVDSVRRAAERRLPRGLFEYVDRGTEQEIALRRDRPAYDRIKLVPRVLVDVSKRSTAQTLFGREVAMPVAIAPTGSAGLVWHRGEIALARAAAAKGIPFTLATRSMAAIETVAAEAGGTLWLQLYASADRAFSERAPRPRRRRGFRGAHRHRRHADDAAPRLQ